MDATTRTMTEQAFDDSFLNTTSDSDISDLLYLNKTGPDALLTDEQYNALSDDIFQSSDEFFNAMWNSSNSRPCLPPPPSILQTVAVKPQPELKSAVPCASPLESRRPLPPRTDLFTPPTQVSTAQEDQKRIIIGSPPSTSSPHSSIKAVQKWSGLALPSKPSSHTAQEDLSSNKTRPSSIPTPRMAQPKPVSISTSTLSGSRMTPALTPLASNMGLREQARAIRDSIIAESDKLFEEKVTAKEARRSSRSRPKRRMPARTTNVQQQHVPAPAPTLYHNQLQQSAPLSVAAGPFAPFHPVLWQSVGFPTYPQLSSGHVFASMYQSPAQYLSAGTVPLPHFCPAAPHLWQPPLAVPANSSVGSTLGTLQTNGGGEGIYVPLPPGCNTGEVRLGFDGGNSTEQTFAQRGAYPTPPGEPHQSGSKRRNDQVEEVDSCARSVRPRTSYGEGTL